MYWRVKTGFKNHNIEKAVIPEEIIALVDAEDANEAIIKMMDEFSQYDLFITCVKIASEE